MWIEEEYDYNYIMGVDEVGRGPFFGDVVACAAIFPKNEYIIGVKDSKKLTEKKRKYLYHVLSKRALAIGIGLATPSEIDTLNILNATKLAMKRAINEAIKFHVPDVIFIDALKIDTGFKEIPIIKGDSLSYQIASASIIAKVTRDNLCYGYNKNYPMYDLLKNKGYGTKKHIEAIKQYGSCELHRKSFLKNYE